VRAALATFITVHWVAFTLIVLMAINCASDVVQMFLRLAAGYPPDKEQEEGGR
jgi:hypothetical protein